MLTEEFAAFAQSQGYRVVGGHVYGACHGFPFYATAQAARKGSVTFVFRLEGKLEKGALKRLRAELPKGCSLSSPTAGQYQLICDGARLLGAADFGPVLEQTVRGLREGGG